MEKEYKMRLQKQKEEEDQFRASMADSVQDRLDVTTSRVNKEYLYNIA